jgi:hypothetical protein
MCNCLRREYFVKTAPTLGLLVAQLSAQIINYVLLALSPLWAQFQIAVRLRILTVYPSDLVIEFGGYFLNLLKSMNQLFWALVTEENSIFLYRIKFYFSFTLLLFSFVFSLLLSSTLFQFIFVFAYSFTCQTCTIRHI